MDAHFPSELHLASAHARREGHRGAHLVRRGPECPGRPWRRHLRASASPGHREAGHPAGRRQSGCTRHRGHQRTARIGGVGREAGEQGTPTQYLLSLELCCQGGVPKPGPGPPCLPPCPRPEPKASACFACYKAYPSSTCLDPGHPQHHTTDSQPREQHSAPAPEHELEAWQTAPAPWPFI